MYNPNLVVAAIAIAVIIVIIVIQVYTSEHIVETPQPVSSTVSNSLFADSTISSGDSSGHAHSYFTPLSHFSQLKNYEIPLTEVVDSVNKFTGTIFNGTLNNRVLSPASLALGLGLLHYGSVGKVDAEFVKLFGGRLTLQDLSYLYDILKGCSKLEQKGGHYRMKNAIIVNEEFPVNKAYLEAVSNLSYAATENLADIATAYKINYMFDKSTYGAIKQAAQGLRPTSALVMINTMHFVAPLLHSFDSTLSAKGNFATSSGQNKVLTLMHQTNTFPYYENKITQQVELPYINPNYAFGIILPKHPIKQDKSMPLKLQMPTILSFIQQLKSNASRPIRVTLPKFRHRKSYRLQFFLRRFGLNAIFQRASTDLKPISKGLLYMSDATHETMIAIDESIPKTGHVLPRIVNATALAAAAAAEAAAGASALARTKSGQHRSPDPRTSTSTSTTNRIADARKNAIRGSRQGGGVRGIGGIGGAGSRKAGPQAARAPENFGVAAEGAAQTAGMQSIGPIAGKGGSKWAAKGGLMEGGPKGGPKGSPKGGPKGGPIGQDGPVTAPSGLIKKHMLEKAKQTAAASPPTPGGAGAAGTGGSGRRNLAETANRAITFSSTESSTQQQTGSSISFVANRTFVYYVRHVPTNLILLIGDFDG